MKKSARVPVVHGVSRERARSILAGALITCAVAAVYGNSLSGPFVFDDIASIVSNPSIRSFATALFPPIEPTVGGRPLLNLSLAANYAIGGTNVVGYHIANIAIHALAALTLFGLVRRTLLRPVFRERFSTASATLLALCVALLWAMHPLQTESVTYVIQRAESLVGLLFLGTLYCFVRAVDAGRTGVAGEGKNLWLSLSVVTCACGMACKEVMVGAPLIVLLYDRTFVAGEFATAWRVRRGYYVALACTWLLLASLVISGQGRGGTAGSGTTMTSSSYALTQLGAIVHYVRLSAWPSPLVFDYGNATVSRFGDVWWQALALVALFAGTLIALWRRSAWGFLGACFFITLAPSSSVVPVGTQTMAEHRMYLALATLIIAFVVGLHAITRERAQVVLWTVIASCIGATVGLASLTIRRNAIYKSEEQLWRDVVAKRPENPRAHRNLGVISMEARRVDEAIEHFSTAAKLAPDDAEVLVGLGSALAAAGKLPEAIVYFRNAAQRDPKSVEARYNLGAAMEQRGRLDEAIVSYRDALRLAPENAEIHGRLGSTFFATGNVREAAYHFAEAVRIDPGSATAHNNLGVALVSIGRVREGISHLEEALRIQPNYPMAQAALKQARELTGESR